jgi:phage/plasmid primase-like uncharacterized protein
MSDCEKNRNHAKENPPHGNGTGHDKAQSDQRNGENSTPKPNGNGHGLPPNEKDLFCAYVAKHVRCAPNEIIADDKIHRYNDDGEEGIGKVDLWYALHLNGPAPYGVCGDWRTGEKFSWQGEKTRELTPEKNAEQDKRRKERNNEQLKAQRHAAKKAYREYEKARDWGVRPEFPYLARKNVGAHGRIIQPEENCIAIPICEDGEKIVSLQYIYASGARDKSFLYEGKIKGCWFTLADPNDAPHSPIVIAEGYATGATIYETTGYPVIVAFNAGNLEAVAKNVAKKYPGREIIIAGDDDLKTEKKIGKNTGVIDARKAAAAINALAVFPPFDRDEEGIEPSDWNDLAALRGKDTLGEIFKQEVEKAKQRQPEDDGGDVPPPGKNDIPPSPPGNDGGGNDGPRGPLPEIQVFSGQLARSVDDAEAALIRANCTVMTRSAKLVMPIWTSHKTADGKETEVVVLKAMTTANLAYVLTKHAAIFVRYNEKSKKCLPIDPPEKMLTALLHKSQYKIPQVVGVVTCPTLRPDGTILDHPGYDPVTRLWMHPDPNLQTPPIPKRPTKRQAQEALKLLQDLLSGYSLVTDLDRCIVIAAILAVVCRGAFTVGPLYLFNAHTAGEGKSHLVDLISTIIRGRPCPVTTMSGNTEEDEKRLGALLLEALSIVSLDNCSVDISSNLLCQIGTQQIIKTRILSRSEMPECEWLGTMFCTGNNVNFVDDMVRRGLTANLNSNTEQPELRPFEFDPIKRVLADRGKYIAAALTIVRAYFVSGEAVECDPLGTYGDSGWSRAVREPLMWLGLPDPWKCTEQTRKVDPFRKNARAFVAIWKECLGTAMAYRTHEIIAKANETRQTTTQAGWEKTHEEYAHPELREFLLEIVGDVKGWGIDATKLGKWLAKLKGQIHDGHRIVMTETNQSRGNRWKLECVER